MARPATAIFQVQVPTIDESDYGSDFTSEEEKIVNRLLAVDHKRVDPVVEDNPINHDIENHAPSRVIRLPRIFGRERKSASGFKDSSETTAEQVDFSHELVDPRYPDLSNSLHVSSKIRLSESTVEDVHQEVDHRSPLQRYRTPPRKTFSVTDLVSPAWCELQYWYTLTIHGRRKSTPAMKQGSVVHKELEDQIHTTVKVDIETKEDSWGLRIWNVIQGLRTLRETGQTRELEIWGIIDGQVVNGVIDEISFICPDTELEAQLEKKKTTDEPQLPLDQTSIFDFFEFSGGKPSVAATRSQRRSQSNKIYLCDVKTRSVRSLPNNVAFRPTKMQLMLYHHIFSSLATNGVDFQMLVQRHNLDPDMQFSDSFIAQVGNLHDEVFYNAVSDPSDELQGAPDVQDSMTMLLSHNSLSRLWSLMIEEFQRAVPLGRESIGNILKAEYRSRDTSEVLGSKTFPMHEEVLNMYLEHTMRWWKGERVPEGVPIEEAYKCRTCDFAEDCEWRLARVEEARVRARANRADRESSMDQ